jgi:hypothetical protein
LTLVNSEMKVNCISNTFQRDNVALGKAACSVCVLVFILGPERL